MGVVRVSITRNWTDKHLNQYLLRGQMEQTEKKEKQILFCFLFIGFQNIV